jgi:hypothetical protein
MKQAEEPAREKLLRGRLRSETQKEQERIRRSLRFSPSLRHFLLSMSLQPCYNLIEINPSRRVVSSQKSKGRVGEHSEEPFQWRLPMTAPRP